jgi:DNA gyrase subunit A
MATNIPPHNLSEVVEAAVAMINNPDITDLELLDIVPGPDFPTGGEILGRAGARMGLMTGRGTVMIRAKHHNETIRGREALVFTEIPYQVNKA